MSIYCVSRFYIIIIIVRAEIKRRGVHRDGGDRGRETTGGGGGGTEEKEIDIEKKKKKEEKNRKKKRRFNRSGDFTYRRTG